MSKRSKTNTGKVKRHGPRYRKVEVAVWGDDKFTSLSAPEPNAQTIWLYLLCGPRTTTFPGLVVAREAVMASDLGWSVEGFREAFAELVRAELVDADEKSGVILLRKALFHGTGFSRDDVRETARPESPNVIVGWAKSWVEIPDGALKDRYLQLLGAFAEALGEGFVQAYREAFRKALAKASPEAYPDPSLHPSSNQDQDQEQDQEGSQKIAPAHAHAHAIPPRSERRHRLLHSTWMHAADEHRRLRLSNVDANARPWSHLPIGEGALLLGKRIDELATGEAPDFAHADEVIRHVVAIRVAEAKAAHERGESGPLKYFIPTRVWAKDSFWKAAELSVEQASAPRTERTGARPAGSSIGPATPRSDHGVSEGLEPFAKGLT